MIFRHKFFLVVFVLFFTLTQHTHAFTIASDPQYVVMNFSEINELNWAAPETEWVSIVKPKILDQLNQLKTALPAGTTNRRLAWSTLQEYMNTPLDTPSEQSYYAIKMRRILEIAEEENLPVFLPLNGFQWWDELPELYNWWDPDGTHTSETFFKRQKSPDFKARFIAGYNPENKWNVEWQNFDTPMKLNWRNWGGGGFRLAPPPNLIGEQRGARSYRTVQEARLNIMLQVLTKKLDEWEKNGKGELFSGITIGTEVSLNASVTPKDEFLPYGFRSTQDLVCPQQDPNCGSQQHWSKEILQENREQAVHQYLTELTRMAVNLGIPKQRIYTHVWGEVKANEQKFVDYAQAAFTPYARPGMSFYGFAEDPFALPVWEKNMRAFGEPAWGAVEYSATKTEEVWRRGLANVLDAQTTPAKIITLYNWTEHKDTPAMQALSSFLHQEPTTQHCSLSEIIPQTQNYVDAPDALAWSYLPVPTTPLRFSPTLTVHIQKGLIHDPQNTSDSATIELDPQDQTTALPNTMKSGVYTWYFTLSGCSGKKVQTSEPRIFTVPYSVPTISTQSWAQWYLNTFEPQKD
jgi:hypothetical protein